MFGVDRNLSEATDPPYHLNPKPKTLDNPLLHSPTGSSQSELVMNHVSHTHTAALFNVLGFFGFRVLVFRM